MVDKFGFIREQKDIKVLILFVMQRLSAPVTLDELTELTMCDAGINYFDVVDCIKQLTEKENLTLTDSDKYTLSAKGKYNSEILAKDLPFSVKEKAEAATTLVRTAQMRNSMIKTKHKHNKDGSCDVELSLSDGLSTIISINLVAVNEKQADSIKTGFRKNAEEIYKTVIKMTTGQG